MTFDVAAGDDRDARRKARYRGKPERARFHRPADTAAFEITVSNADDPHSESSDLVLGMDSIRIVDASDEASMACADAQSPSDITNCPNIRAHEMTCSEHNGADAATLEPPGTERCHSPDTPAELPESSEQTSVRAAGRRKNKATQRRRRPREDIDTAGIEQVAQEVPARMTRSMARKTGVQHPRRFFGEGVSTSQILRPTSTEP
ncbi:hypothetical protein IWW55_003137 [Coemansia sp. RSA 2706]|nr:hypothetical protein IWW55_003137 [Coemansia sp. RSA 2706]